MASTTSGDVLPTGCRIFTTMPDLFFIPEFVFGGLVWILMASTRLLYPANPEGWVMFVSVFCFVGTTLWFFIFISGYNQSSFWPTLDVCFHFVAVIFYLSASVALAFVTITYSNLSSFSSQFLKIYRLEIAAVVMSYTVTLLYFLHAIFSAIRWKRS